jgi:hypothetical protein
MGTQQESRTARDLRETWWYYAAFMSFVVVFIAGAILVAHDIAKWIAHSLAR